jgi:hypothetical protein
MTAHALAGLFEDFNLPAVAVDAAELPPPEPTFTTAELTAARQQAWNDGYMTASTADGRNIAREGRQVFGDMLARSDELDIWLGAMAERNATALARWLVSAFVTAFPDLSNGSPAGRTRAVMELLQSALRSQSKIEVHDSAGRVVSFHTMHDVCRQIESQQVENPAAGNIVIAWQQGEAQIDLARTWADIRSAIMPLASDPAAEASFKISVTQEESSHHVG